MYSSTACDIRSRRAAPAASELIADARARQPLCPRSCSGSRRWWCHLSGSWHVVRLAATPQARQHPRGLGCTGSRSRAVATRRRISDRRPPAARRHPRHLLCSNLGGLMPSEMRRSVVPLPWWGSGGTAVDIFEEVPGAAAHAGEGWSGADGCDVAAHRVHQATLVSHRRRPVLHRRSRRITSPSNAQKSIVAGVDIGWRHSYGFSRSPERQKGPADTNCRAAVRSCSAQDGAVVEFRSQGCCRTATGLTTGPGGPQ